MGGAHRHAEVAGHEEDDGRGGSASLSISLILVA
jgi:hypothetical protein